jgi:hypothetical protein
MINCKTNRPSFSALILKNQRPWRAGNIWAESKAGQKARTTGQGRALNQAAGSFPVPDKAVDSGGLKLPGTGA